MCLGFSVCGGPLPSSAIPGLVGLAAAGAALDGAAWERRSAIACMRDQPLPGLVGPRSGRPRGSQAQWKKPDLYGPRPVPAAALAAVCSGVTQSNGQLLMGSRVYGVFWD